MIAALALLAVASAVMLLMFLRTMDEIRHGRDDTAIVQTLLAAQGGTNLGLSTVQNDVRDALDTIASLRSSTVNPWSFGVSVGDPDVPTASSVATSLAAVAQELQTVIDGLLCDDIGLGDGLELTVRMFVTDSACGDSLPTGTVLADGRFISGARREEGGNQRYALPFVVVSEGQAGEFRRRVVTHGEAQFVVGRRSFARYALFTDVHSYSGNRIWFIGDTLFDGPVHTNGNFGFSGTPWFGSAVSSAGTGRGPGAYGLGSNNNERFFDAEDLGEPRTDPQNPSLDVGSGNNRRQNRPVFADAAPDWRSSYIDLPTNAFNQRDLADADGLRFGNRLARLVLFAGNDAGEPVGDDEVSTYQYIRATTAGSGSTTTTYRLSPSGRLERASVSGGEVIWTTLTNSFNGVIYADERIDRLEGPDRTDPSDPDTAGPAIASFTQLTLVPGHDVIGDTGVRITGDLTYESPPCEGSLQWVDDGGERRVERPVCDDLDARNVFGVFAPSSNITIGHDFNDDSLNAPRDVRIHASLMASSGVVTVDRYNQGNDPRGSVELLGGIIEREYGPFGQFSGGSITRGYGRSFTYDPRLARGLAPPYFPTVSADGVTDIQSVTFGSREQVY